MPPRNDIFLRVFTENIRFDYEPDSSNVNGGAILKEMQDYHDKKYEKR
jgi:hypothetical protein